MEMQLHDVSIWENGLKWSYPFLLPQLLDLCLLDVRCLEFPYGVLAASALFHFSSLELVENVSGKRHAQRSRGRLSCLTLFSLSPASVS